ncbi:aminoglycoside phosphotransferase family protein [Pseudarthrobacter sp. SSS035]|uniref:aminoglycoside phosphotransferase family protein n=1 Tax=Pseudarthrobacter sp. SSS035 TaxID=2931399 RepID=UPI00200D2DEE|nr:aminoglycoside phosphotransferase family protein [Pseudarthrobacter sp. SSS035]
MTVRLPRIHWAVENVDREFEWLPRLASHLHVKVPVPLAKGHPGEGFPWPWTVCRWLEGENPAVDAIADPGSLASDLAGFVSAMRRIDPTDGPPAGRGVPLKTKDADARTAIGVLRNIIDTDAATAAWEAALRAPSWTGSPVWIHGDLSPGNVLCADGRLSAVIDFGIMGVGDPASTMTRLAPVSNQALMSNS